MELRCFWVFHRRGNFYVVKNVKTFSPQRHRGTEVFMYKTDLLVEITITDTQECNSQETIINSFLCASVVNIFASAVKKSLYRLFL